MSPFFPPVPPPLWLHCFLDSAALDDTCRPWTEPKPRPVVSRSFNPNTCFNIISLGWEMLEIFKATSSDMFWCDIDLASQCDECRLCTFRTKWLDLWPQKSSRHMNIWHTSLLVEHLNAANAIRPTPNCSKHPTWDKRNTVSNAFEWGRYCHEYLCAESNMNSWKLAGSKKHQKH